MKKTIKTLIIAAFATTLVVSSCKKDEGTTTDTGTGPTISLTDDLGTGTLDTTNFFAIPIIKINVNPAAGTSLDSSKVELKVGSTIVGFGSYDIVDSSRRGGFIDSIPVSLIVSGLTLPINSTFTLTATFKDTKGKTTSASISYTIVHDNKVMVSNEIELGAQNNTNIEYKFLGLADNFKTYTPGSTGTARFNSDKIDFVYYYGTVDENAFAAPFNANGAKVIWGTEINTWSRQNNTKFKTTTLTAADFDNIKNGTKVEDAFINTDFTSGSTDKVTNLSVGSVYAFKTAMGVVGLAKFTAISASATGSTKVVIICQN
ncbi:MAG: hypothetical protein V4538_06690 [Bacteroidota bacterium]